MTNGLKILCTSLFVIAMLATGVLESAATAGPGALVQLTSLLD